MCSLVGRCVDILAPMKMKLGPYRVKHSVHFSSSVLEVMYRKDQIPA